MRKPLSKFLLLLALFSLWVTAAVPMSEPALPAYAVIDGVPANKQTLPLSCESRSAAYLAGRVFGRHKLAPVVSPGKTIEGALGGLLASVLVSAAVFAVSGALPTWTGAFVGAGIGVCGQLGDLSESFLKRQAGVKDSGDLIPGHGGMLDRVDALLFAFPAALLMFWIAGGSVG